MSSGADMSRFCLEDLTLSDSLHFSNTALLVLGDSSVSYRRRNPVGILDKLASIFSGQLAGATVLIIALESLYHKVEKWQAEKKKNY